MHAYVRNAKYLMLNPSHISSNTKNTLERIQYFKKVPLVLMCIVQLLMWNISSPFSVSREVPNLRKGFVLSSEGCKFESQRATAIYGWTETLTNPIIRFSELMSVEESRFSPSMLRCPVMKSLWGSTFFTAVFNFTRKWKVGTCIIFAYSRPSTKSEREATTESANSDVW